MVLFANYAECDPLKAGLIKSKDQIIPYFVLDHLGSWQGLPGVFMACLFSGALRFVQ
jgi:sodium-coupled monocarboxylate transporter 8/12